PPPDGGGLDGHSGLGARRVPEGGRSRLHGLCDRLPSLGFDQVVTFALAGARAASKRERPMNNANAARAFIGGCAMLLGPNSIRAQDWPQWLGPHRDAKATGFKAPKTWPKELTKKWRVTVGSGVATPALVGDRLYVFSRQGGNEVIRCLKTADGE